LSGLVHVSGSVRRHMQGMPLPIYNVPQPIYNVFVQPDGGYGVALSQLGAMLRTTTGFAAESDAREWIEQDRLLERRGSPVCVLDLPTPPAC
jgi:hypothetical protein